MNNKLPEIGNYVIYFPIKNSVANEVGVITSFNDNYIFVRYGYDKHSKATKRENLFITSIKCIKF